MQELERIFGPAATIELEIDWDRRISFPLAPDLSLSIPSLSEGPHLAKVWVATSVALEDTEVPSPTAQVAFFVRAYFATDEGQDHDGWVGSDSDEGGPAALEFTRWRSSLMSLLVHHPPNDFVFRSRAALFVEVRVTDKEMQLSLEEAVDLMYARATVYQQRPYLVAVEVDGMLIGEHKRAKTVLLPAQLAEGRHNLTVTLKDVHTAILASVQSSFTIQTTPSIGAPTSGSVDSGSGSICAGGAAGQCAGQRVGEAEWWTCPEDALSSCASQEERVCSGHGGCRGSACVCYGDWYGPECSHNMLTQTSFLPPVDPALPWRQGGADGILSSGGLEIRGLQCSAQREFQYGASALAREVWQRQFPRRCSPSPAASFRLRVPLQGIGIMLQFLAVGLVEALESNRTMLLHASDWPWLAHHDCGRAAHDCYFAPISSCSFPEDLPPPFDDDDADGAGMLRARVGA
jgi:hypothetical protein